MNEQIENAAVMNCGTILTANRNFMWSAKHSEESRDVTSNYMIG